jgi:hypothetical protein
MEEALSRFTTNPQPNEIAMNLLVHRSCVFPFAVALAFAMALSASAAVWTGGASGDINDAANWDGDITTSTMVFTNDCTVSLSADATVKQPLTDGNSTDVPPGPIKSNYLNNNVTFDLDGHVLTANWAGSQYWRNLGTSATFTGGGTVQFVSGTTTNNVVADNGNHPGMTLTVTGSGTRFVGSYVNRIMAPDKLGVRFRLLDGAEAEGVHFMFGGFNSTNEISGGSRLRYHAATDASSCGFSLGGNLWNVSEGGCGDVLTISGAGTVVEPVPAATTNGNFRFGYGGNYGGNRLIVENGASLVLPRQTAIGYGGIFQNVDYHSNGNELVVTGTGSSIRNDSSDTDVPTAVGRRGSFNRLRVDHGAFAKLKGLSCGGEVKGALSDAARIVSYVSAWNTVTVDHGSTVDAWAVLVGNQHTDFKQRVAQHGGQCYSNRVEILGGSTFYATNGTTIVGTIAPYFGNVLSVSGAGTTAKFGGGSYAINIGQGGSCSNRFEVLDGAQVEVNGSLYLTEAYSESQWGYAPDGTTIVRGIGNELRIEGAGSTLTGVHPTRSLVLGSHTNGNENVIHVGDGATLTWPFFLTITGFDNAVVVSNGTFNLAGPLRAVWNNPAAEVAGRTRFVFAGAAPKLVTPSPYNSTFQNGAILRFEVPAAGWLEAPLQMTGGDSSVQFDDDTQLEIDAKAFNKAGGGDVPLVSTGKKLDISDALLASWNAAIAPQSATVHLSDDGKELWMKTHAPTIVIIR